MRHRHLPLPRVPLLSTTFPREGTQPDTMLLAMTPSRPVPWTRAEKKGQPKSKSKDASGETAKGKRGQPRRKGQKQRAHVLELREIWTQTSGLPVCESCSSAGSTCCNRCTLASARCTHVHFSTTVTCLVASRVRRASPSVAVEPKICFWN